RQTPPGAPKATIWQNSFHYFRPCSNDDKPSLLEQHLDCARDLRVKLAAILAVLLAAAALAGAAMPGNAQTGGTLGSSPHARSTHSLPQPPSPPHPRPTHACPHRRSPPLALPERSAPPQEAYPSFPEPAGGAAAPGAPSACQLRLAKVATFQALGTLIGAGDCGAPDAVQLQTVVLPDQTKVAGTPPSTPRRSLARKRSAWRALAWRPHARA